MTRLQSDGQLARQQEAAMLELTCAPIIVGNIPRVLNKRVRLRAPLQAAEKKTASTHMIEITKSLR